MQIDSSSMKANLCEILCEYITRMKTEINFRDVFLFAVKQFRITSL